MTAKDKASGKAQSIRIEAGTGLSKEDIERMQKEAEVHATEDAQKKELVDAKNLAEQLIYTSEKALKDAPTVPDDIKKNVESQISNLKSAKDAATPDLNAIKSATEALSSELSKIGEYMNKQQTPNQSANADGTGQATENPDIKDAEIKEEKPEDQNPNSSTSSL